MKWYYNLKISRKLLIGFIFVAVIAGILGIIGIINIKSEDRKYSDLYEDYGVAQGNIGQVSINYQLIRVHMRELIIATSDGDKSKYVNDLKENEKNMNNYMSAFEKAIKTEAVRNDFNKLSDNLSKFNSVRDKIVELAIVHKENEAIALMHGEAVPLANALQDSIDNLIQSKITLGRQTSDDLSQSTNNVITIMSIIVIIAMIAAIIIGIFISRIISKPINKMVEAADKLALGDINVNVESNTEDEIGSLAKSFTRMIANVREQARAAEKIAAGDLTTVVTVKSENDLLGKKLSEMIEKNNEVLINIRNAAEQVALGSKQVSDSSIELSQGATEQASSIEELTASLEEISSQTKLNAENSNQANELAESAKSNAVQGSLQMNEMLKAMEEINDASGNISKIIKVIDEIAFQTNILALNAAVEAARAGQHGKGFAVVAEEVRNLAARSAKAAKETTDMIESSIKKAEGGTKIAKDTADALSKIVNNIEKVASLVNDIAIASNEQATGISQINQGIIQVSQVIQANSTTSEESAAASEELSSQASLLKEMVAKFNLKQNNNSYNNLNALSPEILKMLEEMTEKNGSKSAYENAAITKPRIILSDKDFGKY